MTQRHLEHTVTVSDEALQHNRRTVQSYESYAAHYDTLVVQCGWQEPDFTAWLTARMQDALHTG